MARRIVFYTKIDCPLCDNAREILEGLGVAYEVVYDDPRFVERVPVIEVDGRVVAEGRVFEPAVRRRLRRRWWRL